MRTLRERDIRFAENLAQIISERGVKQKKLAQDAQISEITLNRIVNKKQAAGGKAVDAICSVLKVSSDEMYGIKAEPGPALEQQVVQAIERGAAIVAQKNLSEDKQKLIALIPSLSDSRVRMLLDLLDKPAVLSDEDERSPAMSRKR